MNLSGRMRRLERGAANFSLRDTCAECGRLVAGPRKGRLPEGVVPRVRMTWRSTNEMDDVPSRCPKCGALIAIKLLFDNAG